MKKNSFKMFTSALSFIILQLFVLVKILLNNNIGMTSERLVSHCYYCFHISYFLNNLFLTSRAAYLTVPSDEADARWVSFLDQDSSYTRLKWPLSSILCFPEGIWRKILV